MVSLALPRLAVSGYVQAKKPTKFAEAVYILKYAEFDAIQSESMFYRNSRPSWKLAAQIGDAVNRALGTQLLQSVIESKRVILDFDMLVPSDKAPGDRPHHSDSKRNENYGGYPNAKPEVHGSNLT